MNIQQGDIVLLAFDPSIGHEIKKVRPAIIIQNNVACKYSPLLTVVPCSSRPYRNKVYEVLIPMTKGNGLLHDSVVLTNQIGTYDQKRVQKVLGTVEKSVLEEIYLKIDLHLGK